MVDTGLFEPMDNEGARGVCLLTELELLLRQDPLIDEVGFVHPSQLTIFHSLEGKESIASFGGDMQQSIADGDTKPIIEASYDRSVFWSGDHKLAISVQALPSLYMTAKYAYLSAYQQYKCLVCPLQNNIHFPYVYELEDSLETVGQDRQTLDIEAIENELMSHSKVLVLLSCDYASAWNSRKQVISHKSLKDVYCAELQLSTLVLSYAPKSEQAWSYRYWVIGQLINGVLDLKEVHSIFESESDFVEHIVERSHMNYRAWRHRYRLVNHMLIPQVLNELHRTKKWAESHVGDNCCFHYRRVLFLQLHQKASHIDKVEGYISPNILFRDLQNDNEGDGGKLSLIWKEELNWNKDLIAQYFGRESTWKREEELWRREIVFGSLVDQLQLDLKRIQSSFQANLDSQSLWLHRRFLFYDMVQQTSAGSRSNDTLSTDMCFSNHGQNHPLVSLDIFSFVGDEFDFIDSWVNKSDTTFEDVIKQKEYAAMYSMWMILHLRRVNRSPELFERVEKERIKLKVVLENMCPQRTLIWEDVLSV